MVVRLQQRIFQGRLEVAVCIVAGEAQERARAEGGLGERVESETTLGILCQLPRRTGPGWGGAGFDDVPGGGELRGGERWKINDSGRDSAGEGS